MIISDTDLQALIDAEAKATKLGDFHVRLCHDGLVTYLEVDTGGLPGEPEFTRHDAAFYEAIRSAAPSLLAELRASREIIAKLPRTADGVAVTPGMLVWPRVRLTEDDDGAAVRMHYHIIDPVDGTRLDEDDELVLATCYSSPEAALASKGER